MPAHTSQWPSARLGCQLRGHREDADAGLRDQWKARIAGGEAPLFLLIDIQGRSPAWLRRTRLREGRGSRMWQGTGCSGRIPCASPEPRWHKPKRRGHHVVEALKSTKQCSPTCAMPQWCGPPAPPTRWRWQLQVEAPFAEVRDGRR